MRTVGNLIKKLQTLDPEDLCYAYEGEGTGLIILKVTGNINEHGMTDGYSGTIICTFQDEIDDD